MAHCKCLVSRREGLHLLCQWTYLTSKCLLNMLRTISFLGHLRAIGFAYYLVVRYLTYLGPSNTMRESPDCDFIGECYTPGFMHGQVMDIVGRKDFSYIDFPYADSSNG